MCREQVTVVNQNGIEVSARSDVRIGVIEKLPFVEDVFSVQIPRDAVIVADDRLTAAAVTR